MKPGKTGASRPRKTRPPSTALPAPAEQLRRAQRLAMVGRLAAMAAHELGNYLSIVLGNATLLKESARRGEPDLRLLDALTLGAEGGARMARQLRNLARPSAGEPTRLDLAECARTTFTMMESLTPCVLTLESVGQGPLFVNADETWLDQILVNLVLNAVDATRAGRRVRIRTGRVRAGSRKGWCYLEVLDEGAGIPLRIRREMRDLFFTTKVRGRGTGIGLALVSELVGKLGGELAIRSRAGRGAAFRVLLPAAGRTGARLRRAR